MLNFKHFMIEATNNIEMLKILHDEDQNERNQYTTYLKKYPDWQQAAKQFAKDKNRSTDDIFNDAPRLKLAKEIIQSNIKQIKANPSQLEMAWLLVQHMENEEPFQQWFLKHLKKGSSNWKYLTDRILTNKNMPQKYGTQTGPK